MKIRAPRTPQAACTPGPNPTLARRDLLRLGALGALAGLLPARALAAPAGVARASRRAAGERSLRFRHLHTGESLQRVYWAEGAYVPEALADINHLLRDHHDGEIKEIDRGLLDLLHRLAGTLETREPFHVICGYRSPATNALLASRSQGVARRSLHVEAKAADVFLPDRDLAALRRTALALRGGGVGYYPRDGFVHVDVGRVRFW